MVSSLSSMNTSQKMTEQRVIFNSTTVTVDYGLSFETHVGFGENTTIILNFSWCPMDWSWLVILQLISVFTGIVRNFQVIVVLLHRRSKNRSTDTLIGGLAFADFFTSVFLIPIPTPVYIPKTWLGEVYCRLVFTRSLLWTSITASAYLLMSLSVERYITVVYISSSFQAPHHSTTCLDPHRYHLGPFRLIWTFWLLYSYC